MKGLIRLNIVFSMIWLLIISSFIVYEYTNVSEGVSPYKFIYLADKETKESYGKLSKSEIQELGKLESELGNPQKGEKYLNSQVEINIYYKQFLLFLLIPILLQWLFFISFVWVYNGFKSQKNA